MRINNKDFILFFANIFLLIFANLFGSHKVEGKHIYFNQAKRSYELDVFNNSIYHLGNIPFEQIVTIGSNCLTKFRILSYLKKSSQSQESQKQIENPNHLFDWFVPLNYTLFGEALLNDFNDSFDPDVLKVGKFPGMGAILVNPKYGFIFNHAFDGIDEVSSYDNHKLLTTESFHKYFYLIKDKYDHLKKNSRKAFMNNKRTVYIVYACSSPSKINGQKQIDFVNLMHSIKSKRDQNFLLIVLVSSNILSVNNYEFDIVIEDNLIFHEIKLFSFNQWHSKESIKQWDDILQLLLLPR